MTPQAVLLTDFQTASLQMTLVVNSMVPQILVADLVCLVSEIVVNLVELVLNQLMIYFVVEILFLPYADIMI